MLKPRAVHGGVGYIGEGVRRGCMEGSMRQVEFGYDAVIAFEPLKGLLHAQGMPGKATSMRSVEVQDHFARQGH